MKSHKLKITSNSTKATLVLYILSSMMLIVDRVLRKSYGVSIFSKLLPGLCLGLHLNEFYIVAMLRHVFLDLLAYSQVSP